MRDEVLRCKGLKRAVGKNVADLDHRVPVERVHDPPGIARRAGLRGSTHVQLVDLPTLRRLLDCLDVIL